MGPADAEQTFTVQGCEAVSQTLCATEQHLGMSEPSRMRKEPTYYACFPRGISFLSHLKGTKVLTHLNSSPPCHLAKRTANKNFVPWTLELGRMRPIYSTWTEGQIPSTWKVFCLLQLPSQPAVSRAAPGGQAHTHTPTHPTRGKWPGRARHLVACEGKPQTAHRSA